MVQGSEAGTRSNAVRDEGETDHAVLGSYKFRLYSLRVLSRSKIKFTF